MLRIKDYVDDFGIDELTFPIREPKYIRCDQVDIKFVFTMIIHSIRLSRLDDDVPTRVSSWYVFRALSIADHIILCPFIESIDALQMKH